MSNKNISENIGRQLQSKNKTQKWLADQCGVTKGQINHIVRGKSYPSLGLLLKIAVALGVETDMLLTDYTTKDKLMNLELLN